MEAQAEDIKECQDLFAVADSLEYLIGDILEIFNTASKNNDYRPSKISVSKDTFLYLLRLAVLQFKSINLSCKSGYAIPSFAILRSMLENLISVKYIKFDSDPEGKTQRFKNYRWVEMKRCLKYWKESPGVIYKEVQAKILEAESDINLNVDKFKKNYDIKDDRQLSTWSGISVEQMAGKVEMFVEYHLTYRLCCMFSHPGFLGALHEIIKTPEHTIFSTRPSSKGIVPALKKAIIYMYLFLEIFDEYFNLNASNKICNHMNEANEVFKKYKVDK